MKSFAGTRPLMPITLGTPLMAINRIESLVAGTVWKIERQNGDILAKGETILIIESMKMEIPIDASAAGTLRELLVAEGESVSEGQVLAIVSS
jgi:acetyl-CoA carboxylase biotin carboxyl carrier protein